MIRRTKRIPYASLQDLLSKELLLEEDNRAARLMQQLRHVHKDKRLSREEFLQICRWKSPRAIRQYARNREKTIARTIRTVLSTRSERQRLAYLTKLKGVSVPMASAILTLINPDRYGVMDIRVWQLLYAMKSVRVKPSGQGFNFKNWYHYLRKLRYLAKKFKIPVRMVERTLFEYHKKAQLGRLYRHGGASLGAGFRG